MNRLWVTDFLSQIKRMENYSDLEKLACKSVKKSYGSDRSKDLQMCHLSIMDVMAYFTTNCMFTK